VGPRSGVVLTLLLLLYYSVAKVHKVKRVRKKL